MSTRAWLEGHPRIHHAFVPVGACWLNPAGRLVAHLPQSRPRRPIIRQPRRHYLCHRPGKQPTQLPCAPMDLGRPTPPTRPLRRRYVYSVWGIQHEPPTSTGDEPVLRKAGVGGPCGRSTRRSDDELRLEGNVQVVRSVSARWPCLARCEW
jgi:hypothetical protein